MTASAALSITSVRSPPLPRVPVSRARSTVVGAAASMSRETLHRAPAQPQPIGVECCTGGAHLRPMLSDGEPGALKRSVLRGLDLLADGPPPSGRSTDCSPRSARPRPTPMARVLVLGVAGTGKTRVLEARFGWLVAQGCAPERIGVLVPTAARAAALRARLETRLRRGYEELFVLTPAALAGLVLRAAGAGADPFESVLTPGDRLAMLVERIDELSLRHHDFGGRPNALLGGFVRRIDRLKAELVAADEYLAWAQGLDDDAPDAELEREFAQIYCTHERMLAEAGARDDGDLIVGALGAGPRPAAPRTALRPPARRRRPGARPGAGHAGDGGLGAPGVTIAGDPHAGLRRYRGAGAGRMHSFRD